jgi:hypothetical protein
VFDGPGDRRDATAMPLALLTCRPRWVGLLCLLVTAVGWGLNWPAMKFLLREWPPLSAHELAGLAAALALALLAALAGTTGCLLLAAALNVTAWDGAHDGLWSILGDGGQAAACSSAA